MRGLLLALVIPLLQAPPRDGPPHRLPAAGNASVSGRVYSAATGAPVRGALVMLTNGPLPDVMSVRARAEAAKSGVATDAEGRFQLTGVAAGSFYVIATPSTTNGRYLAAGYGAVRANDPGRTILVPRNGDVRNVDIALPTSLAIEGRVVDESGEPLSRVVIFAGRYAPGSEVSQRVGGFGNMTDDLGRYRLYGLEPGTYVVAAEGRAGVAFVESDGRGYTGTIMNRDPEPFALTFHPSTLDESSAHRIRISTQDVNGVDITLLRSRRLQLSGMVVDSRGQPAVFTSVALIRRGLSALATGTFQTDPLGRFHVGIIEPGEYRLLIGSGLAAGLGSVNGRTEFAEVPVTMTADITELVVTTRPGIGLAGEVVFAESPPLKAPPMKIALRRPEGTQFRSEGIDATMDDALRFYASDVFGPYLIRVSGLPVGWGVKAVTLGGADITDLPTAFTTDHENRLHVVLSSRVASLEGKVRGDAASPGTGAKIYVFAEDRTSWRMSSPRTRIVNAGENGMFTVADLVPGRYYAVAFAPDGFQVPPQPGETFFELLSRGATPFVINENERRELELPLWRWPE